MSVSRNLLSNAGPFVDVYDGFMQRDAQMAMAEVVEQAMRERSHLIVEAGTGVGKTLAYLIPAIAGNHRVVISTATRNLQDQLFSKDLPVVSQALRSSITAVVLKGRSNYLCPRRLRMHVETTGEEDVVLLHQLQVIRGWWNQTLTGDLAEVSGIPEQSGVWSRVTSTVDNCLSGRCPDFDQCPLFRQRRKAEQADLVIVNHSLLFAGLCNSEESIPEFLSDIDSYVLDEAHQVPQIAASFLGDSFSSRTISELCRDIHCEHKLIGGDDSALAGCVDLLDRQTRKFVGVLNQVLVDVEWTKARYMPHVHEAICALSASMEDVLKRLEISRERSDGLLHCHSRALDLIGRFALMTELHDSSESHAHWIEADEYQVTFQLVPIDIGDEFNGLLRQSDVAWVFTSATLTVAGSFDYFRQQLGLGADVRELALQSPFTYRTQALLLTPVHLPEPSAPDYGDAVFDLMLTMVMHNYGGTFLLFTSYRMLDHVANRFRLETSIDCLVQGAMSRTELLDRFRQGDRSVLLGTSSFWEGVDVKGDQLTCVCVDKLPFRNPSEPLLKARLQALRKAGVNGFTHQQVPEAAMALKQGFGRLIRNETDRGVFVVADPRLLQRNYGRVFLESLPAMPLTTDVSDAIRFFRDCEEGRWEI